MVSNKREPYWNLLQTDNAASESNTDPVRSDTKPRTSNGTQKLNSPTGTRDLGERYRVCPRQLTTE